MRVPLLISGLALVLALALALAGCSGDSDDGGTPADSGGLAGGPVVTTTPCEIYIPDLVEAKDNNEVLQIRARSEENGCSATPGYMSCEAYYEAADRAVAIHAQSIIKTLALQVGCQPQP